ncbi:MAG: hypothetical protein GY841_18785, partial [FCB group bacterium]|nr:hypothetical protein [FCB group bacterium]
MSKSRFSLVVTALIVFIVFGSNIAQGAYICGDANSDGALNVGDAVFMI